MFKLSADKRRKSIDALINPKSHVQKKYFSLMLVPSYSTGKTRSIRIPYRAFYAAAVSFLAVAAVVMAFYLRSNHFQRVAQDIGASLDQAQEAYLELQENSTSEQNRLLDDSQQLKSQLTEEQLRSQAEKREQRQSYQESLESMQEQIDDMEQQLQELDESRQEVLSQLGAKAYIPPINAMLDDLTESQTTLFASLGGIQIRSDERSATTDTTESDLEDYFVLLSSKIQAQLSCFTDLQAFVKKMNPYIKNYPTRWPVNGQVSSGYGYRTNPMGGRGGEFHDGLDIRCSTGTSVRATGGGTVSTSGWHSGYGYLVIIDHGFGLQTVYGHNSKLLVSVGQRVERGDIIARSGNTGRSTGPHVHYEVRLNGSTVNPSKYFLE